MQNKISDKNGVLAGISVEPTYISTELITPGNRLRSTLPSIAMQQYPIAGRFPWGNESMECPNHKITYSHFNPSTFSNASVDLTHRHHGTRVVQMPAVHQPYEVTSLRLSKCRINDQRSPLRSLIMKRRLPSFNNDLIPKRKISEPLALNCANRYFTHQSKFQVFPSSNHQNDDPNHQFSNINHANRPSKSVLSAKLSKNTLQKMSEVNDSIYKTTTHMRDFANILPAKRSSLKSKIAQNESQKRVSFEQNVEILDNDEIQYKQLDQNDEEDDGSSENHSSDLAKDAELDPSKNVTFDTNDATIDPSNATFDTQQQDFCQFCGKRKGHRAEMKVLEENERLLNSSQNERIAHGDTLRKSPLSPNYSCRPLGLESIHHYPPNYRKLVIEGCNNRPRGPKRFFDICQCDEYPELIESVLKAEAMWKRKAANFKRRNCTTISVFHKLKQGENNNNICPIKSEEKSFCQIARKKSKKMPRWENNPLNQKSKAHARFHEKFPELAPDLRDAKKPLRRVMVCGYHSHVFR